MNTFDPNALPELDRWVCRRCGCACTPDGARHTGGGPGMRSCRYAPDPVRRADLQAEAQQMLEIVRGGRLDARRGE